jgi:uncharacterized protein involved in exopolysaccharide biosynthesis
MLYPRRWRERYGAEFDALMEDVEPDWQEFANVLGGALKMQMRSETAYLKLAAVLGVIGVIVALGASLRVPEKYVSTAELKVTPPTSTATPIDDIERMRQEILSRNSLAELIQRPSFNLYASERKDLPLEDVIERMRRDIQVTQTGTALNIAFTYSDREKARKVVRELTTKFTETNIVVNRYRQIMFQRTWKEDAPPGVEIAVIAPASDAHTTGGPNRLAWAAAGLLAGALLAATWRWPRRAMQLGAFAVVGCVLAGAAAYLMPNRYTSTAVLRFVPSVDPKRWYAGRTPESFPEHFQRIQSQLLSDQSLKELILRQSLRLYSGERRRSPIADVIRTMRERDVRLVMTPPTVFQISFTYEDPLIAQAVVREFVTKATEAAFMDERSRAAEGGDVKLMADRKMGELVEVLDPASLPATPVWPNRLVIALLGLGSGLLFGIAIQILRRPRGPSEHAAVPVPVV